MGQRRPRGRRALYCDATFEAGTCCRPVAEAEFAEIEGELSVRGVGPTVTAPDYIRAHGGCAPRLRAVAPPHERRVTGEPYHDRRSRQQQSASQVSRGLC